MSTVREMIEGALETLGVLADGENASASEAASALKSLNKMIGSWNTQNLLIYARVREEFTLTSGKGSYSIGTGGDFNTARPEDILHAAIEDQSSNPDFEIPVRILTQEEWARTSTKELTSTYPSRMFVEGTYPTDTIQLWPVPTATHKLVLYTLKPLTKFSSINDTVALPEGYEEAVEYNLAIRLAPKFGKATPPEIIEIARESLENIKRRNLRVGKLKVDLPVGRGGRWDYRTGGYE